VKILIYFTVATINIMFLILLILVVFHFTSGMKYLLFTMTFLNFIASTIYAVSIILIEHYKFRNQTFIHFIKDIYYKYLFILAVMMIFSYWNLVYLGGDFMSFSSELKWVLSSIYVHLLIPVLILSDFFITPRKKVFNIYYDLLFLILWVGYVSWIVILAKHFEVYLYPFLQKLKIKYVVFVFFMSSVFGFFFNIFYYYWISNHSPKKYEAYHKELEKERIIANDDIFIEQNNSYNTI